MGPSLGASCCRANPPFDARSAHTTPLFGFAAILCGTGADFLEFTARARVFPITQRKPMR